jgi:tetratricopeptide (TPR) repeat protein
MSDCINPTLGKLIFHFEMGQLEDASRDRFEEHLLKCDFCREEVEQMYTVTNAMLANRAVIRAGLEKDGLTFEALKKQLAKDARRQQADVNQKWRWLVNLIRTLKEQRILWPALGTTGVVALAAVVYFLVVPTEMQTSSSYVPYLRFQVLPYEGSLTLRGETVLEGKEQFDKGMEAYLRADYKQAAKYLKIAVDKSPKQADWWLYLGVCHFLRRDAKPAIKALDRADELAQGSIRIRTRWFLAQAYLLQGDRDKAEPLLEWVVTQKKDYADEASDLLLHLRDVGAASESDGDKPSVIDPIGGEVFLTGSTISIMWNDDDSDLAKQYQVWLSTDGGVTFPKRLVSEISGNEMSWDWVRADIAGSRLCVRVNVLREEGIVYGLNSRVFNITDAPSLSILTPHRGEQLRFGSTKLITWTSVGTTPLNYNLELYKIESPDTLWVKSLTDNLPGTVRSWLWKDTLIVGDEPESGEHFLVKLVGLFSSGQVADWSDGDFALLAPSPLVVVEVGSDGTPWIEGDRIPIHWQCTQSGVQGYSLQLCETEESEGMTLASNLPATARDWIWRDARPPGTHLIRVIAHLPEGNMVSYSPSAFEIQRRSYEQAREIASADEATRAGTNNPTILLQQNYPNPFNPTTTISFDLTEATIVKLTVYNTLGQIVITMIDGPLSAGHHSAEFDGRQLASGMYLYRLEAGGQVVQKTMMLAK